MESEERRGKSRQLRVESEGNEGGAGDSGAAKAATEEHRFRVKSSGFRVS